MTNVSWISTSVKTDTTEENRRGLVKEIIQLQTSNKTYKAYCLLVGLFILIFLGYKGWCGVAYKEAP